MIQSLVMAIEIIKNAKNNIILSTVTSTGVIIVHYRRAGKVKIGAVGV